MAKNEIKVMINVDDLDEAIEKANQPKRLLTEAQLIIDSLSSVEIKIF